MSIKIYIAKSMSQKSLPNTDQHLKISMEQPNIQYAAELKTMEHQAARNYKNKSCYRSQINIMLRRILEVRS